MPAVLLRLRLVVFLMLYLPFYSLSYGYDGLNGVYYLPDKDYDDKPGWFVGVNMPRKSCMTYTFFENGSMVLLGGDHSRGHTTFFAMISDKRWNFVGDEEHAVEVFYDGRLSWSGRGFGVEVSSYKGVTIENLTEDDIVSFGRGSSLALLVDGMEQGRFSLKGTRDAIHRMLGCMIDVEAGRIPLEPTPIVVPSLEARNHPEAIAPRSGATPITPAPQRSEEGRETSSQMVRYDQGDNWSVNINKSDQVCQIDLSLGRQRILVYAPVLSGVVQYNATFVDNDSPSTKNEYDYEIGNHSGVFSSGKANSFAYKGRGYYIVYGLTDEILNAVFRSKDLLVKFDGDRFGEYDLSGFSRGFGRFSDCVEELGVRSPAEAREEPDRRYDGGDGWSVLVDKSKRTCGVTLDYGSKGLILNSNPPSARTPYYLAFVRDNWTPAEEVYEFEIGNETQKTVSMKAETFRNDTAGFAVINGLKEDFLDYLTHSRVLRTKAKGIPPERYDLSGFGHAFERFSDCLKDVRGRKPSTPPKVRRMN